jgi:hypothetical protein
VELPTFGDAGRRCGWIERDLKRLPLLARFGGLAFPVLSIGPA